MFEKRMYTASPAGNCHVKMANITGIIQSIIWLVDCCRGSVAAGVVIFCWMNIEMPTSTGSRNCHGVGENCTKSTRSMPRNRLSNGIWEMAGFHE